MPEDEKIVFDFKDGKPPIEVPRAALKILPDRQRKVIENQEKLAQAGRMDPEDFWVDITI